MPDKNYNDAQDELADRLQDAAWMAQRIEVLDGQLESQRRETERLAALVSSWQATAQRLAEAGDAADRRVIELEAQLKTLVEDRTFNPTAFEELIAGIESDRDNAIDASDGNGDYYLRTATRQIEAVHAVMDLAKHYGLLHTTSGAE